MDERIGFGLYQSCANRESVVRVSVFSCDGVSDVCGEWVGCLEQGLEEWVVLCLCEF